MKKKFFFIVIIFAGLLSVTCNINQSSATNYIAKKPRFKVLALYENGGHHVAYSTAARIWLNKLAADSNFVIDFIQKPDAISENFLNQYQLFIQLDYAPYAWSETAMTAFEKYIKEGKGGWFGFHHATLLG